MISKEYTYAIIGASNNTEKYGYKVLADLKEGGYNVIPVNPKEKEILGLKVFADVNSIDKKVDVVVFVVPPAVTEAVLKDVKICGINNVWMQPGSESEAAINYCKENGIDCIHNACVMIERKA